MAVKAIQRSCRTVGALHDNSPRHDPHAIVRAVDVDITPGEFIDSVGAPALFETSPCAAEWGYARCPAERCLRRPPRVS
jgi:hypothetical protein